MHLLGIAAFDRARRASGAARDAARRRAAALVRRAAAARPQDARILSNLGEVLCGISASLGFVLKSLRFRSEGLESISGAFQSEMWTLEGVPLEPLGPRASFDLSIVTRPRPRATALQVDSLSARREAGELSA